MTILERLKSLLGDKNTAFTSHLWHSSDQISSGFGSLWQLPWGICSALQRHHWRRVKPIHPSHPFPTLLQPSQSLKWETTRGSVSCGSQTGGWTESPGKHFSARQVRRKHFCYLKWAQNRSLAWTSMTCVCFMSKFRWQMSSSFNSQQLDLSPKSVKLQVFWRTTSLIEF